MQLQNRMFKGVVWSTNNFHCLRRIFIELFKVAQIWKSSETFIRSIGENSSGSCRRSKVSFLLQLGEFEPGRRQLHDASILGKDDLPCEAASGRKWRQERCVSIHWKIKNFIRKKIKLFFVSLSHPQRYRNFKKFSDENVFVVCHRFLA